MRAGLHFPERRIQIQADSPASIECPLEGLPLKPPTRSTMLLWKSAPQSWTKMFRMLLCG